MSTSNQSPGLVGVLVTYNLSDNIVRKNLIREEARMLVTLDEKVVQGSTGV